MIAHASKLRFPSRATLTRWALKLRKPMILGLPEISKYCLPCAHLSCICSILLLDSGCSDGCSLVQHVDQTTSPTLIRRQSCGKLNRCVSRCFPTTRVGTLSTLRMCGYACPTSADTRWTLVRPLSVALGVKWRGYKLATMHVHIQRQLA